MNASTPERTCKRCAHPESAHVLEGHRCDTEVSDWGALDCQCPGFQPVRVEEPAGEPCDGSSDCKAETHLHGCLASVAEMRFERDRLLERLAIAEAYIPSRDFADYQGDVAADSGEAGS